MWLKNSSYSSSLVISVPFRPEKIYGSQCSGLDPLWWLSVVLGAARPQRSANLNCPSSRAPRNRLRSNTKVVLAYICLLIVFRRLTWLSVCPLLYSNESAASTAGCSRRRPITKVSKPFTPHERLLQPSLELSGFPR